MHHTQVYKERILNTQFKIDIPNIFINLYNLNLFDRTIAFAFKSVKVISNFPFEQYIPTDILEMKKIKAYSQLTIIVVNFIASLNSLQEFENNILAKKKIESKKEEKEKTKTMVVNTKPQIKTNNTIKKNSKLDPDQIDEAAKNFAQQNLLKNDEEDEFKLDLKITLCAIDIITTPNSDTMEITCFSLKFGFDETLNVDGFPLIILPVLELNYDLSKNIIRLNIPSKEMESKQIFINNFPNEVLNADTEVCSDKSLIDKKLELHRFLHNTKSLTLFIYYKYLEASTKIFQNFLDRWNITLKKYFKTEENKKIDDDIIDNQKEKDNQLKTLENGQVIKINSNNNIILNKDSKSLNQNIIEDPRVNFNRIIINKTEDKNDYLNLGNNQQFYFVNDGSLIEKNHINFEIQKTKKSSERNPSNTNAMEMKINLMENKDANNGFLNNTSLKIPHNKNISNTINLHNFTSLNKNDKKNNIGDSHLFNYSLPKNKNTLSILNDQLIPAKELNTNTNLQLNIEKFNSKKPIQSKDKSDNKIQNPTSSLDQKISNIYKNTTNNLKNQTNNINCNNNNTSNSIQKETIHNLVVEDKKPGIKQNNYLKLRYGDNIPKFKITQNKKEQDKKTDENYSMKLFLALFDLKIIYYVKYEKGKKEFENIFSVGKDAKEIEFFGYIIRIHSSCISFKKTLGSEKEECKDTLKVKMNLFSMSYLDSEYMNDELYFKYDKDIAKYFKSKSEIQKLLELRNNKFINTSVDNENSLIINGNNFDYKNHPYSMINFNQYYRNSNPNINNNNYYNLETENIDEFYKNLKIESEFLNFMELKKSFRYKYLNDLTFDYFYIYKDKEEDNKNAPKKNDSKESGNSIIKIINVNFKRISMKKSEDMLIKVNRFEILYNKYNKDLIQLIIFEDVLKIVDKLILKVDLEEETDEDISDSNVIRSNNIKSENHKNLNNNKNLNLMNKADTYVSKIDDNHYVLENNLQNNASIRRKTLKNKKNLKKEKQITYNTGSLKFFFSLRNPKIRIENEIKGSHIILISEEECSVELSDICLDSAKKDFFLNINLEKMNLLSYTMSEKKANKILESPQINFNILNKLESKLEKIDSSNEISINVAKIRGFFQAKDFQDFYNILEILLYDRTESYATEKKKLDDKIDVLKGKKKLSEIKALIEKKTSGIESQFENSAKLLKKIKFNVNEVDLALKQVNAF